MYRTRSICTHPIIGHVPLRLTFQRRIAATHQFVSQIVEAMISMRDSFLVKREIFTANRHDEFVEVAGDT